ncbi:MAG: Stp1/IreP family PP2C-type Ser/Thr phosphatase [Dehalococcoidia bacterium]
MKRSSNQDAHCALLGPNAPPGTDALIVVADGMGGHQAGEIASNLAIQGLLRRLSRPDGGEHTIPGPSRMDSVLAKIVRDVNEEVNRGAGRPETRGMGTTLTAGILLGNRLFLAHVGDSRGYLFRNRQLKQLTRDHSWVAEEVARGALTPQQAQEHPRRNILTRALGVSPSVEVDHGGIEVQEGDVFLICSDGLHGLVSDEAIAQTLARLDPQPACEALTDMANSAGGPDNITVVVARVEKLNQRAGSYGRSNLDRQSTVQLAGTQRKKGMIAKALRILFFPLGLPVWLLMKIVKLAYHRR